MSLNAVPSFANSSRPRTGTRSVSRPRAIPCAASASPRSVRTIERPSTYATSETSASDASSPSRSRLRDVASAASISACGLSTAKRTGAGTDARRDERAVADAADPDRLRLPGHESDGPVDAGRRGDDRSTVQQHERVGRRESGAGAERVDERRVERNVCDRRSRSRPARVQDVDLLLRGEAGDAADVERVARGDDVDAGDVAQHPPQVRRVARSQLLLEVAVARERIGGALRGVEPFLVAWRAQRAGPPGAARRPGASRSGRPRR